MVLVFHDLKSSRSLGIGIQVELGGVNGMVGMG